MKMKRFISLILLITCFFSYTDSFAYAATAKKNTVLKAGVKKDVKRETPKKKEFKAPVIEDELANELVMQKHLKNQKVKKVKYQPQNFEDDGIYTLKSTKVAEKKTKKKYKKAIISDEEVILTEEHKKFKRPVYTGHVKTENGLEVVLKPVNKIKTKNSYLKVKDDKKVNKFKTPMPAIGERVAFRVVNDVEKDGEVLIPKNTVVYAKIGEVSPRAMGGAPAEMTIEGFEMMDKQGKLIPLDGEIASSGYSLSFWIGLAELATTPFLFGLAVPLLRLLPGGQAVVSPRKNYVVYY